MPREGTSGIGRSYSRGGPPFTRSISGGVLKNNRGRRSLRLKWEVDEGIAVSLSEDDGKGHEGPCRCYNPVGQTHQRWFDSAIAQRPVQESDAVSDERYL